MSTHLIHNVSYGLTTREPKNNGEWQDSKLLLPEGACCETCINNKQFHMCALCSELSFWADHQNDQRKPYRALLLASLTKERIEELFPS